MSGSCKLIGTFGSPIDAGFTGVLSVGNSVRLETQESKLGVGQNYALRTVGSSWRICIMSIAGAVIAKCTAEL